MSGIISRDRTLRSVDFPQPPSPTIPINELGFISNEILSKIVLPSTFTETFFKLILPTTSSG